MTLFRKWTYYAQSVVRIVLGFRRWISLIPLFMQPKKTGEYQIELRRPPIRLWVRGAMDVWAVKETFLDAFYTRYGATVQDGWTVIDIGAGLGDFSIMASYSHLNTRVYAFEPFPGSFDLLQKNLALNGLENVHAFQQAIWSQPGMLHLDVSGGEPLQIGSQAVTPKFAGGDHLRVDATTLEDVLIDHGISRVDLLKLDCEGAEYEILMGTPAMTLARIQRIILETHDLDQERHHARLIPYLESAGFAVRWYANPVHADLGYLFATREGPADHH